MTRPNRKPYIAGNWKMNLDRARSLDLIKTVKGRLGDGGDREVAFFVPSIYLADVSAVRLLPGLQGLYLQHCGIRKLPDLRGLRRLLVLDAVPAQVRSPGCDRNRTRGRDALPRAPSLDPGPPAGWPRRR